MSVVGGVLYQHMVMVDTSAAIALNNPEDPFHRSAHAFLQSSAGICAFALNATSHEAFTRARYDRGLESGLLCYDLLRSPRVRVLAFDESDEQSARGFLEKYSDQILSYHDALCAAVMLRLGIYRIFTFDRHFWTWGFEILPGETR